MEQHLFGAFIGTSSLLVGYLLHQLSQMRSRELSYLQHVPQFTDLNKLRKYLGSCPENKAEVLVEGTVKKLGTEALKSEMAGVEGAARLVTTTTYKKVYYQSSNSWKESSNTIENVCTSVPFTLSDRQGNLLTVLSVKKAGGFRQILERVWQDKTAPDSRSFGDYATNMTVKEMPNGSLTSEYLLVFGSSMAAYGIASLNNQSLLSNGTVKLVPTEVSSSIQGLISRNEMIVDVLKFFSVVLFVAGGGVLLFSAIPLAMAAFSSEESGSGRKSSNS